MPTYGYANPVLLCDYSDPDAIADGKSGASFYMTASSFNYSPGLPILESADLVNWRLVNYAAPTIPLPQFDFPGHAKGIWAPSLRYRDGRYLIVVGLPDEGIYVTEAEDPKGSWSPLKCVWKGKGFIDPCPIWDDDGKAWIVHAYARSRCGINGMLGIMEADPATLVCKAESDASPGTGGDRFIYDGRSTQPTIEGPKIYKRDGWYYIFAPAGGVETGWQTVLRGRDIMGPYDEKIVMASGTSAVNGPHQGALVRAPDGSEWFLHFQSRGVYGRILHLQPVAWRDGWPCMGTAVETSFQPGEPVPAWRKPCLPEIPQKPYSASFRDWQWTGNFKPGYLTCTDEIRAGVGFPAGACLPVLETSRSGSGVLWDQAHVLTRKISELSFVATVGLAVADLPVGARSGLLFLGGQYAAIEAHRSEDGLRFRYIESENASADDDKNRREIVREQSGPFNPESGTVSLSIHFDNTGAVSATCAFSAWVGPTEANGPIAWHPNVPPFKPSNGAWVGGRIGLYAIGTRGGTVPIVDFTG